MFKINLYILTLFFLFSLITSSNCISATSSKLLLNKNYPVIDQAKNSYVISSNYMGKRIVSTTLLIPIPTFHSISLYWKPKTTSSGDKVAVRYRKIGSSIWSQAINLWFDDRSLPYMPERSNEYRGSIVNLEANETYEIEVFNTRTGESARNITKTWSEKFPVSKIVNLPKESATTFRITTSGKPSGYTLYTPPSDHSAVNYAIDVSASYVIVRGVTMMGAKQNAIRVSRGSHDVIIEDNDISNWGRIGNDGWGCNYDSGIFVEGNYPYKEGKDSKRVVIQNNRIHHPRANSNNWEQKRTYQERCVTGNSHPQGPHGIVLFDTGGNNVIRYNKIFSDENHKFNDGIGGGSNFSYLGSPGPDSDIYGNIVTDVWDDAIESEGSNQNVRIYNNFTDKVYMAYGLSPTILGPLYLFRNISYRSIRSNINTKNRFCSGSFVKAQSKMSDIVLKDRTRTREFLGGGRVYVFHNTLYNTGQQSCMRYGISGTGTQILNYVSRNNILDTASYPIQDYLPKDQPYYIRSDFDYDLISKNLPSILLQYKQERNGIRSQPILSPNFSLKPNSPGIDGAIEIPNFNDDYIGKNPDVGAQEYGLPIIKFGNR